MEIKEIRDIYGGMPQCGALVKMLEDKTVKTVFLKGLLASSGPMFFSALSDRHADTIMFVLQDADEAGYFYHDLTQLMGTGTVLPFFISTRREIWTARCWKRNSAHRGAESIGTKRGKQRI